MREESQTTGITAAPGGADRARRQEAIQDWLVEKVSGVVGVEPEDIDVRESLATYGLGSIAAVSLTGDLEAWLKLELSPTLVWEYPTIHGLAEHLDERLVAEGREA